MCQPADCHWSRADLQAHAPAVRLMQQCSRPFSGMWEAVRSLSLLTQLFYPWHSVTTLQRSQAITGLSPVSKLKFHKQRTLRPPLRSVAVDLFLWDENKGPLLQRPSARYLRLGSFQIPPLSPRRSQQHWENLSSCTLLSRTLHPE